MVWSRLESISTEIEDSRLSNSFDGVLVGRFTSPRLSVVSLRRCDFLVVGMEQDMEETSAVAAKELRVSSDV